MGRTASMPIAIPVAASCGDVLQQMEPLRSVEVQYVGGEFGKSQNHTLWFDEEDYYPGTTLDDALKAGFGLNLWSDRVEAAFEVCSFLVRVMKQQENRLRPHQAAAILDPSLLPNGAAPAARPGAAAAGRQSRHESVDVTTAQFAGRMIGPSGVSGPPGDVTGIGGAAIVNGGFCALRNRRRARTKPPLKGEGYGTPCSLERAKLRSQCAACLAATMAYVVRN